ncbi:Uncharacterised protein [Chlamydia trachomatis]|nr:Uncharacterised protein [Chlamydia trachomatis]CRI74383.1 Uncharacterised protein [Chlamydia trachomatis]
MVTVTSVGYRAASQDQDDSVICDEVSPPPLEVWEVVVAIFTLDVVVIGSCSCTDSPEYSVRGIVSVSVAEDDTEPLPPLEVWEEVSIFMSDAVLIGSCSCTDSPEYSVRGIVSVVAEASPEESDPLLGVLVPLELSGVTVRFTDMVLGVCVLPSAIVAVVGLHVPLTDKTSRPAVFTFRFSCSAVKHLSASSLLKSGSVGEEDPFVVLSHGMYPLNEIVGELVVVGRVLERKALLGCLSLDSR